MTSESIMNSKPFMRGASIEAPLCASPQDTSIVSHWERQRHTTPDNIAVVADDDQWSYEELGQQVDRFASALVDAHVSAGDHVGICVDRSPEAIAAMLGIMKIGAAFVPLDPDYPADRIAYMVADANLGVILGHQHYRSQMGEAIWSQCESAGNWIDCEDILRSDEPISDRVRLLDSPRPTDLAYIMYTSGSTGKPKGVEIEHGALTTYCFADIECYRLREDDRTLQFSTLCFDIAIEEIFPPLLCGSTVVVRPKARGDDANELTAMIDRYQVTAIHVATAYWHSWVDLMISTGASVPESLRLVIVTGEKVSVEHYKRWRSICLQDLHWCNAYGPTEATVTATVFVPEGDFDGDNMPIGKPLPRYTAHILDKKLEPVAEGETGELYLGGPALARGYHRRDDLTERAFLNVTLVNETPGANLSNEPTRLYRTGDLARWLPDGNIDFGGRVDHQIKLGSYRIEPAEIESVLNRADGVLESLVSYDEVDGKKFLVAYIARGTAHVSASELAGFARQSLPAYMIPVRYVLMESFPKTINGKIDRQELPPPNTGKVAGDSNRQSPRNELERKLAAIWCEVLNLPEIGIHDDFFLLGGSSLLVTQVITKLNVDFQIEMPVRDFFANPTVATAASQLNRLLGCEDDDLADENAAAIRDALPTIESKFIPSDSDYLYSVLYAPRKNRLGRGVVLAHSVGHEYTRGYRNLQQLAIQLCSAGFDVLRFDYAGTGNSTGDCGVFTVETMRQNLVDARNHLLARTDVDSVDVVGLRLGAAIAATTPHNLFSNVLLWDPVCDGQGFLHCLDRLHDGQLGELTRYNVLRHRHPEIDQAYGHAISFEKRASIANLTLSSNENSLRPGQTHFVLTSGESLPSPLQNQNVHEVSDVIAWDDDRYLESAFSSPESFQVIQKILLADDDAPTNDQVENHNAPPTPDHREVAITFGQYEHLSGVWNSGGTQLHSTAVIFLTAGMLHHAGPFRLHARLASKLGEHSVSSLRFDLSGIGESLAVGSQTLSIDRAADEVRQAMDWIETHHNIRRFVLFGLCSGADDALHVAQNDGRVAGIIAMDGCGYPTMRFYLHRLVKHYLVRILRPSKWLKLLRDKLKVSDQTVPSLGFGEDIREFPPREVAESQLCQLTKQGRNAHFIYTGGVGSYYNHDRQFSDMFPRLRTKDCVTHAFYPTTDHVAFLVEDREALIQDVVDKVLQFRNKDDQGSH